MVSLFGIITIQLRAPPFHVPITQGEASASRHSAASGTANFFQLVHRRTNAAPANRAITPAAAYRAWVRGVDSDFAMP